MITAKFCRYTSCASSKANILQKVLNRAALRVARLELKSASESPLEFTSKTGWADCNSGWADSGLFL